VVGSVLKQLYIDGFQLKFWPYAAGKAADVGSLIGGRVSLDARQDRV